MTEGLTIAHDPSHTKSPGARHTVAHLRTPVAIPAGFKAAEGFSPRGDTATVLSIKWQDGPVRSFGVNGVQLEDVLDICRTQLAAYQERVPCPENAEALQHLNSALHALARRTADRVMRGVDGTQAP